MNDNIIITVIRESQKNDRKITEILYFDYFKNEKDACDKFDKLKDQYKKQYMFKNEELMHPSTEYLGDELIKRQEVSLTYDHDPKNTNIRIIQQVNPKEVKVNESAKELSRHLMDGEIAHFVLNGSKSEKCFTIRIIRKGNIQNNIGTNHSESCDYYLTVSATSRIKSTEIPIYLEDELSWECLFIGHLIIVGDQTLLSDSSRNENLINIRTEIEKVLLSMSESYLKEDDKYTENATKLSDILSKTLMILADNILSLEESHNMYRELYYSKKLC